MPEGIQDAILSWYGLLSSVSARLTPEVRGFDERIGIPFVTALLLGILGAAAPCQLTHSIGALTVLGRQEAGSPRLRATLAFLGGKSLVYTALGVVALALGAGLTEVSIPVFVAARKVLGPLMVVIGLGMVGVLRFRSAPEIGSVGRLRTLARQRAERAPMLLGVASASRSAQPCSAPFSGSWFRWRSPARTGSSTQRSSPSALPSRCSWF